ncbi:ABC transporter permease [Desulfovibrio sp. OttesenSCG-928-G11]|nr:ABC transporter permease [Desulfovibrio sp. OttesenSCG-928-G11]
MKNILNIKAYYRTVRNFLLTARQHRRLTYVLAKREISDRYIGQALGGVWAVLHPMLLLTVYFFLFSVVFKIRIPDSSGFPTDYFLYILSGLAPWLAFAESTNKGPVAVYSQSSLVKQVVFPIEILPLKGVLTSFVPLLVMGSLLLVYKLVKGEALFPGLLLLPAALLLQIVLCTGINMLTSAVGTYLRDLKDLIQALLLVVIYLMPIFYLPEMVPNAFRPLIAWNPLSHLVWCWQDVFYYNAFAHPWSWLIVGAGSVLTLAVGTRVFAFLKTYFGNVL